MTLEEIMQKITELSASDRALLLRELDTLPGKPETDCVTQETAKALNQEREGSHDERGLPIEDVLETPKAKIRLDPLGGLGRLPNPT